MDALVTIESINPEIVYAFACELAEDRGTTIHCFSRLPTRQLLRYISLNRAEMWWISEYKTPSSINPSTSTLLQHLQKNSPSQHDVVVLEGLEWFLDREGDEVLLAMLQQLDSYARVVPFQIIMPVDPLAFDTRMWSRIKSIAPVITKGELEDSKAFNEIVEGEKFFIHDESLDRTEESNIEPMKESQQEIVHLASLPFQGFSHTILAKRMLQWKRMGFDLSELEPALSVPDLSYAYGLYAQTESTIILAVDALRFLTAHHEKLTVTEKERFHYRIMSLFDVENTANQLQTLVSLR